MARIATIEERWGPMTKLVLIHGINNQDNDAERIERDWIEAVQKGLARQNLTWPDGLDVRAAFYGKTLDEETISWGKSFEGASAMSAASPPEDFITGREAALYQEFKRAYGLSDEEIEKYLDEEDERPTATIMARGIHKKWLKAIARALEAAVPSRGKFLARRFLRQAAAYLEKPGLKDAIDEMVYQQVFSDIKPDDDVVVISHSLGTVVAYSLLRQSSATLRPKLFLTAGSPLGIEIVKQRLGAPLICLENAPNWVNVADLEDFVALKPELTGETFGCENIENITMVDNGFEDAHDIRMYLQHDSIAGNILRAVAH